MRSEIRLFHSSRLPTFHSPLPRAIFKPVLTKKNAILPDAEYNGIGAGVFLRNTPIDPRLDVKQMALLQMDFQKGSFSLKLSIWSISAALSSQSKRSRFSSK